MEIKNFVMTDEGQVLGQLQPYLNRTLNPHRMSNWVAGRRVLADQQMPVILKEPGGVYRRFLHVRGLPSASEMPQLTKEIDVHNQKRAIMPLAAFEYHVLSRKASDPYIAVKPAQQGRVFWVAGTYSLKPGSMEPDSFYPKLVRAAGGLGHASSWEPFFIDLEDAQCWLEPFVNRMIEPEGRPFEFFRFGKDDVAA
jgi:hypothetical protein